MELEEEFIDIVFNVVWQCNKTQYDSYSVKDAPVLNVKTTKVSKCSLFYFLISSDNSASVRV